MSRQQTPTPELMQFYVDALRPLPAHSAQALPLATAKQEADILIKRAHDSAPLFGDVDPPLHAKSDKTQLAAQTASETAQEPLQDAQADGVDTTQPPTPEVPRTGLHGRPIITLKSKVRRVIK